jgi:outer membrane protein assembly factor BamB
MSSHSVRRLVCLLALGPVAAFASEPRFWRIESASQFLAGDASGTAIDSDGHLRLALASEQLHDPETASIWALARNDHGVTWAGTGDGGVVYRIEAGQGRPLHEASSPHVYAVALGPDGRLYSAHSPDGRVEAVSGSGAVETVYDPEDRYVWALAFDPQGRLLVATGAAGRVYRVGPNGEAQTLLESAEAHITALAVADDGTIYAGSAPGGILYRIATDGAVFALHDSSYEEVKSLAVASGGRVYAALVGGGTAPQALPAAVTPAAAPSGVEVTVVAQAAPAPAAPVATAGGAVLLLRPDAAPEALWRSAEAAPHALLAVDDGVLVGTGDEARLFLVRDDRSWAMQRAFPASQVTALARGGDGRLVLATSNPGRVYELSETQTVETGEFVSVVHDATLPSLWGRLSWEAQVPPGAVLTLETRSGNTATPDATWAAWSAPATDPSRARVESEEARFLQVKATLSGSRDAPPRLASIHAAYLQRNQRPSVGQITVHPPGQVFQKPLAVSSEPEILGLEPADAERAMFDAGAALGAIGGGRPLFRRGLQMLTWSATDANGDVLEYDVEYRPADAAEFRTLRRGLEEAVLTWDTTSVPDGRYLVRVLASDRRANPPELALAGEQQSAPFQVDNTPPLIGLELAQDGAAVRASVRDSASPILRLEYSIDAGRWVEAHPVDGIADSPDETFSLAPLGASAGGERQVLVVRALDRHGNSASAMIELQRP